MEEELFYRGINIGRDGSVIQDNDQVYVLTDPPEWGDWDRTTDGPIQLIDYFTHIDAKGVAVAQTTRDEHYIRATDMISARRGRTVERITFVFTERRL